MNITRLLLWTGTAVAAVAVTTAAVAIAGASDRQAEILTQDQVNQQLDAAWSATPLPPPSATPTPAETPTPVDPGTAPGAARTLVGQAGQLVVRCDGGAVSLESWSPNPGYYVDDVRRGPADRVSVEFESDTKNDVEVFVTCVAGEPVMNEVVEYDDHGGDRHDD